MVEIIIQWLQALGVKFGFFRLSGYITFRALAAMATSLLFSLIVGYRFIIFLYHHRMRDTSGDYQSIDSASKKGTPTAGGLLIICSVFVSLLAWAQLTNPFVIISASALLYFGLVGCFDDWQKVKYKSSLLGLSQKAKTLLMLGYIIPFAIYMISPASPLPVEMRTQLYIPFYKEPLMDIGPVLYVLFIVFVFFSIINSLNITDGLDGLLTGTALMTYGVYGVFTYVIGNRIISGHYHFTYIPAMPELTVVIAALMGGLMGFLWFNTYPAEIFMGDTGSLSIGSILAITVISTKQEILFLIAGGLFVFEIFSSFMQQKVGNRIGRRIFLRAPIHHSFIHQGIAEPKTVVRFWIFSLLLSFIALMSIKIR